MDTALELRIHCEHRGEPDADFVDACLRDSALVRSLTSDLGDRPLFWVWRLMALSEIPHAQRLGYTRRLAEQVLARLGTSEGFSLSGKADDLLPCYNAMLTRALTRLGYGARPEVRQGLRWILNHQAFERGLSSTWAGVGIQKYGGCLHATPCYIGVVKSVNALLSVRTLMADAPEPDFAAKLQQGLAYLMRHQLFRRLSDGAPIYRHITDLSFPESYQVNLVELLLLAKSAGLLHHEGVAAALALVRLARSPDGSWAPSPAYRADGYRGFDGRSRHAPWLSYLLGQVLEAGPCAPRD